MQLVKKILSRFNGLYYPQEYLCFEKGSLYQPLHVYLVDDEYVVQDITAQHLFVGYHPLVFALAGDRMPDTIQLLFSHRLLSPNERFDEEDALAWLEMDLVKKQQTSFTRIFYYEGVEGTHHFLTPFQQRINGLINKWYNKKPGNVFLKDNLYTQVQIAYSVPRLISLITQKGDGELFNLFPTDLHGPVGESHYLISLRTGGKALEQVEKSRKVLLSQVHGQTYQSVYTLGKNHMQGLKSKENFPFSDQYSEFFGWPLPQEVLLYRELTLTDSFVQGIHSILLFTVDNLEELGPGQSSLVHIHNSYATWRHKTGLSGNYLLR